MLPELSIPLLIISFERVYAGSLVLGTLVYEPRQCESLIQSSYFY